MQTFLVDLDYQKSASMLSQQHLVKQCLENLQIAQYITGEILLNTTKVNSSSPHASHPACKMWKSYQRNYYDYMKSISNELLNRNLATDSKMHSVVEKYYDIVSGEDNITPNWLTDNFILTHRNALLYKSLLKKYIYEISNFYDIPINEVTKSNYFLEVINDTTQFKGNIVLPALKSSHIASQKQCITASGVYFGYEY